MDWEKPTFAIRALRSVPFRNPKSQTLTSGSQVLQFCNLHYWTSGGAWLCQRMSIFDVFGVRNGPLLIFVDPATASTCTHTISYSFFFLLLVLLPLLLPLPPPLPLPSPFPPSVFHPRFDLFSPILPPVFPKSIPLLHHLSPL